LTLFPLTHSLTLFSYKIGWKYNLQEKLWFIKPDFKVKNNKYFDPKAWKESQFVYQISKADFVTQAEFETYSSFSSK
jgi:hypothetical protein